MYRVQRAQTAIVAVIIAAVALVIGLAIYAYFQPLISSYFLELQIQSTLSREISNQRVDLISTYSENNNFVVWLVYSNSEGIVNYTYYLLVANASFGSIGLVLNCSDIDVYQYIPSLDNNGIVCDTIDNDCVPLSTISIGTDKIMFNPMGRGWVPLKDLYELLLEKPIERVELCKGTYPGEPQIIKLVLPSQLQDVKIYLLTFINDRFYVLQELRVSR